MKKLLMLFLLFLILPTVSWGYNDSCSFPKQYTVDKRCYVTEEQKKEIPYSATVEIDDQDSDYFCTGTIIRTEGKLYLYTAKHCVVDDEGLVKGTVWLTTHTTPEGEKINGFSLYHRLDLNATGMYDVITRENFLDDWAIYEMPSVWQDSAFTSLSDKKITGANQKTEQYDARVVGYGALKIMSDTEIENFKEKYIRYLKAEKNIDSDGTEWGYSWYSGGVKTSDGYGKDFVSYLKVNQSWYYSDLFRDSSKLKVSKCKFSSSGSGFGCQTWAGNSGGGIFDNDGKLMGIYTKGWRTIGGKYHASSGVMAVSLLSTLFEEP